MPGCEIESAAGVFIQRVLCATPSLGHHETNFLAAAVVGGGTVVDRSRPADLMLPRNLTLILVAVVVSFACHLMHQRTRTAMVVGEALSMIDRFYVEDVDSRGLLLGAMKGMTDQLDRNSEFIPPRDYTSFQSSIEQEFAGIGIYVSPSVDGPVRVLTPLVGSPALDAGLLPGDEFIRVDGVDVSTMKLESVTERLRGPIGTRVALVVRRRDDSGASIEVAVEVLRANIQLESVVGDHRDENNNWVYRLTENPRIAYARMTSFGDKTVGELRQVLERLDNDFDAFILDLRGNGGGLLHSAVDVTDMFLDEGKIVSTKTRGGRIESEAYARRGTLVANDKPIAVLIDHDSASASEIVAAALQDHDRATIVGTRSYGKGTVQNILLMEYGRSALRLTVAKYFRPSDRNIHRNEEATDDDEWGVTPDDGMIIELDEATARRLGRLWEQDAYPSLKGVDRKALLAITGQTPSPDTTDSADAAEIDDENDDEVTKYQVDVQLRRAVQAVMPSGAVIPSEGPESTKKASRKRAA